MKMTDLMKLWKLNKKTNTPFLGTMDMLNTLPFMEVYRNNYNRFDKDFIRLKGFLSPTWNRNIEDTDNDVLDNFKEDVDNLLFRNSDNYQRMFDALNQEYKVLENFDRYEESRDDTTSNNKTTNEYGAITENYNYGKVSHTDVDGAIKQTDNHGLRKQTDTIGQHKDDMSVGSQTTTTTHKVAGFNGGLTDATSDTTNNGSRADSTTYGSQTNSTTVDSVTDVMNKDSVTNTHTEDAKNDIHSTEARADNITNNGSNNLKHEGHLHGNIGVTTNQQMLESEIKLRSSYNIYTIIYNDITTELCNFFDEGIDAFYAGLQDIGDDDNMEINVGNVSLKVEQTKDGALIIAKDDNGTTTATISNGTNGKDGSNGKDGITPKFKVEDDGDIFVDYSGNEV